MPRGRCRARSATFKAQWQDILPTPAMRPRTMGLHYPTFIASAASATVANRVPFNLRDSLNKCLTELARVPGPWGLPVDWFTLAPKFVSSDMHYSKIFCTAVISVFLLMISRIRFEARIECYRRKIGVLFSSVLFNLPPSDYGWTELAFSLRIDTSFENFSHNGRHTLAITVTDGRRLACFFFCFPWPRALFAKCSYILIHDATVLLGCFHLFRLSAN